MKTVLDSRLSAEERLAIETYACDRLDSVEETMRDWRADRKTYADQMDDDFEWRKSGLSRDPDAPMEIFEKENGSLNLVATFAEYTAAKAQDDIFGSSPYYAMAPEGKADKPFAKRLQKHSEWKLQRSTFKQAAKDCLPLAAALGEAILKVRWLDDVDYCEAKEVVLVDAAGKPIVTRGGDYIYRGDEIVLADAAGNEYPAGQDLPVPEGVSKKAFFDSLKSFPRKAPETIFKGKTEWKEMIVEKPIVRYRNVDAYVVSYLNFIAPLNVPTLEAAVDTSIVGQTFDLPLLDMQALLKKHGVEIAPEILSVLQAGDTEPKAEGTTMPREGTAEVSEARRDDQGQKNPVIKWAEVYFSYYLADGKKRRIFGIMAREARKLVFCEYLGIVTPRGKLPYFVSRTFAIAGRWYGKGYYEKFADTQEEVDRNYNYVRDANRTNRVAVKAYQPDCIEELDDEGELEISPDEWMRLRPGKSVKEAFQFLELPALDANTMELLRLRMQVGQARSGVTGPGQAAISELPQNSTATGVEALISVGQVLSKVPISGLSEGIEQALEFAILVMYSHFDAAETFTYEEGDRTLVDRITPEEVENLELDVRLILTRFRQREQRENAQNAATAVLQYLNAVPDPYKKAVRPFYVQIVNGYGFEEADAAVPEPIEAPPAAEPARISQSISYKDAPDDIRRQMEAEAGYTPSQIAAGEPKTDAAGNLIPAEQQATAML